MKHIILKKLISVACSLALAGIAVPAAASITISTGLTNTDDNVQFNDNFDYTDVNPLGTLTNGGVGVTFTGLENLNGVGAGQARIEASDGSFSYLEYALTDPAFGFKATDFNINVPNRDGATLVDITMYDQFGGAYTLLGASLGNGGNKFNGVAADNQFIVRVVLSMNGNTDDVRQVRLGEAGIIPTANGVVPEPATWAMLIVGFGLVGGAMRGRNRSEVRFPA